MLDEMAARGRQILEEFLEMTCINCEWIMRIDLDVDLQGITQY